MKEILLLCPSRWDALQLARCRPRWEDQYAIVGHGADVEERLLAGHLDALAFVDESRAAFGARRPDGVTSSDDYPGCIVAAVLARDFGTPGTAVEAVLASSHKRLARHAQRRFVPEATPWFRVVDPDRLDDSADLTFPCFVKPVKSWFSVLAQRLDSAAELAVFAARPEVRRHLRTFTGPFNQLLERYAPCQPSASALLAEELLCGQQVTLEGFAYDGEINILGIVDALMYPGTLSFRQFTYPSSLDGSVQARMADIAARVMHGLGFAHGQFNIELFYDPAADRISIIEINPRMSPQFADLFEWVDGTNTYEVLLALAAGERPCVKSRQGPFRVAASFPLRAFADQRVRRVPGAEEIAQLQCALPVSVVLTPYRAGQRLSDVDTSDGASHRYAVVNLAGHDLASLLATFATAERRLSFELGPLQ